MGSQCSGTTARAVYRHIKATGKKIHAPLVVCMWESLHLHTKINIQKYVIQLFNELYLKNAWSCLHVILHCCKGISVYELFNEQLTELPTFLDSFSSIPQVLTQGWWGAMAVVEKHVRKLDHQMGLNKVLLCLKHHKKQPNQQIIAKASNLLIYGPVSAC